MIVFAMFRAVLITSGGRGDFTSNTMESSELNRIAPILFASEHGNHARPNETNAHIVIG